MQLTLRPLRSLLALALCAGSVQAQDYVESFTGSVNAGGWTFGNTIESIEASNGNPGAFLHNQLIDTFAPQLRTTTASNPFHGDWRALGVQSFGVDLKTFSTQFPYQREATLMLSNGSCTVYYLGTDFVPQVAEGWKSFDYAVDSASTTMPAGWLPFGSCTDPNTAWNNVMTNVTEVRIFYGDPTFFFIFDQWNVGADNPRISGTTGTPFCFGDGSGTTCPCGNNGGVGEGCANSTGQGAVLAGAGGTSVAADALHFSVEQVPAGNATLLFVGSTQTAGGAGSVFGDGLFCPGGTIVRLGVSFADGQGNASWASGLAATGGWGAGDTRHFQVWYRNPVGSPCGQSFNTSNGVTVNFTN